MSAEDVKREEEETFPDEERLGAREANLVCLSLKRGEEPITLKVQRQNAEDVYYRMGKNVRLGVLMMDYYDREDVGQGTVQFIGPEGDILIMNQTPHDLNLEDGDVIDAMFHQHGG